MGKTRKNITSLVQIWKKPFLCSFLKIIGCSKEMPSTLVVLFGNIRLFISRHCRSMSRKLKEIFNWCFHLQFPFIIPTAFAVQRNFLFSIWWERKHCTYSWNGVAFFMFSLQRKIFIMIENSVRKPYFIQHHYFAVMDKYDRNHSIKSMKWNICRNMKAFIEDWKYFHHSFYSLAYRKTS